MGLAFISIFKRNSIDFFYYSIIFNNFNDNSLFQSFLKNNLIQNKVKEININIYETTIINFLAIYGIFNFVPEVKKIY